MDNEDYLFDHEDDALFRTQIYVVFGVVSVFSLTDIWVLDPLEQTSSSRRLRRRRQRHRLFVVVHVHIE